MNKTAIDQILRWVLVLLQNNSLIFEFLHIDTGLQHLVVDCEYVQLTFLLVPGIAVGRLERELLVGVVALDDCHHLLYFVLVDIQHAESRCVELEGKYLAVGFVLLNHRVYHLMQRLPNVNIVFLTVRFLLSMFVLQR